MLEFQPLMQEPEGEADESMDTVPAPLDFSYILHKRSNSGSAGSSSPFVSPLASRSSSVTSRSRGSRGSTDTSHGTRPNSRSNSSNATSFSTTSWLSLSSVGLTFSDNRLDRIRGMGAVSDVETRFLVSYPGPQFSGFGSYEPGVGIAPSGEREECVSELSFPASQQSGSSANNAEGLKGFLTLRDFTILADLVERSLRTDNDDSSDVHPDDASDSDDSIASGDTDLMESTGAAAPQLASTCCCEYYQRLFDTIPLVSGLRPTVRAQELPDLMSSVTIDDDDQGSPNHHELYAHHGRQPTTPLATEAGGTTTGVTGVNSGSSNAPTAIADRLKANFERKRTKHDEALLEIVRPHSYFTSIRKSADSSMNTTYSTRIAVPAAALEEARSADERFRAAAMAETQDHTTPHSEENASTFSPDLRSLTYSATFTLQCTAYHFLFITSDVLSTAQSLSAQTPHPVPSLKYKPASPPPISSTAPTSADAYAFIYGLSILVLRSPDLRQLTRPLDNVTLPLLRPNPHSRVLRVAVLVDSRALGGLDLELTAFLGFDFSDSSSGVPALQFHWTSSPGWMPLSAGLHWGVLAAI
ncbi:hypothetical protein NMY22_g18631 [Coprinellus aureogranulatus]|nr:hypothetical protein NMY22_g18631 [Coprinellus aureogranulatus]